MASASINLHSLVPYDRVIELLKREELFCTWTFFEEKYQFLTSLNYLSIKGSFNHETVHKIVRFVVEAASVGKGYNKMKVEQVQAILGPLYTSDFISIETIKLLHEKYIELKTTSQIREVYAETLIKFIVISQYSCKNLANPADDSKILIRDLSIIRKVTNFDSNKKVYKEICENLLPLLTTHVFCENDRKFTDFSRLIFALLATPEYLIANEKRLSDLVEDAKIRFLADSVYSRLTYTDRHFIELTEIIKIKSPFFHFYKIGQITEYLDRHQILQARLETNRTSDFNRNKSIDSDDFTFVYRPVLLPKICCDELARLLFLKAELIMPVFNFLNKSLQASDFLAVFNNLKAAKIVFFQKFLEQVSFDTSRKQDLTVICKIINVKLPGSSTMLTERDSVDSNFLDNFHEPSKEKVQRQVKWWVERRPAARPDTAVAKEILSEKKTNFKGNLEKNLPLAMKLSHFFYSGGQTFESENNRLYNFIIAELAGLFLQKKIKISAISKFFETCLKMNWTNHYKIFSAIEQFWKDYPKVVNMAEQCENGLKLSKTCAIILMNQKKYVRVTYLSFLMQNGDEQAVTYLLGKQIDDDDDDYSSGDTQSQETSMDTSMQSSSAYTFSTTRTSEKQQHQRKNNLRELPSSDSYDSESNIDDAEKENVVPATGFFRKPFNPPKIFHITESTLPERSHQNTKIHGTSGDLGDISMEHFTTSRAGESTIFQNSNSSSKNYDASISQQSFTDK